mmetsp:Transcript_37114/g.33382  ORF Transcript_37114/g.33382 Transcript_37114/m.33382 type:complete len:102 (-) Transcript_37114:494-799(-)|eukprot:CAMPEP_0114582060 /NCGR_PEP_ID=MMETSP0125-20121206/6090_1 /TAXON_ID=485358 ORGANISM="Aristerostoma sp., Strain ATCC 50986" /NCGR_SAMPLE_ID=MMETSP0125 /ASSEMBLY_ACC=CAM_ASM_000245 /LENGTH=101 /DNA_ID=CAMNT_0001774733 /DNA_START=103 /DNA_END=408 /DNA_ORIENTATION=+
MIRHGESIWNKENKYTGWADVPLTEKGQMDAAKAGQRLKELDFKFDLVFTSVLGRANHTYRLISDYLDCYYLPVIKSYRLNTIHYGALEGLHKEEALEKYG